MDFSKPNIISSRELYRFDDLICTLYLMVNVISTQLFFFHHNSSEKQLREWTATYSVDERGSVLDGLFSFVSGLFSKKEEVKGTSPSGDNVAKVNYRHIPTSC